MSVLASETCIETMRVAGRVGDSLALRIGLARALSSSGLRPRSLPPSAILCVRRLHDPLPGALRIQRGDVLVPPAWRQAVSGSLDDLVRRAARPVRDPVAAGAEAVLFADRSELLACLAADWIGGGVGERWWWRGLLPAADIRHALLASWLDAPEYVPAALRHLADRGQAVPVVRALTPEAARTLVQRITHAFALPHLQAGLDVALEVNRPEPPEPGREPDVGVETPREPAAPAPAGDAPGTASRERDVAVASAPRSPLSGRPGSAPWQPWVPETGAPDLQPEHQSLLGVALMVQRCPAIVRTSAFSRAVRQWRPREGMSETAGAPPAHARAFAVSSAPSRGAIDVADSPAARELQTREHAGRVDETQPTWPAPSAEAVTPPAAEGGAAPPIGGDIADLPPAEQARARIQPAEAAALPSLSRVSHDRMRDTIDPLEESIQTELGGLFYLINIGLFLGLYGDFTTPAEPGIELSIWDFVALLGLRLLGERVREDPVWSLLARLACRADGVEPGMGFDPPGRWSPPPDWLAPFPEAGVWGWAGTAGRLRVRHPEEFMVLDLPRDASPVEEQLLREIRPYHETATFTLQPAPLPPPADISPLDRWVAWLAAYLRARLGRALGLERGEDPFSLLCAHEARVTMTAAHLDITLRLDELPLAVRIAGLDRDPGWVPAAGRIIAFHFE